MTTYDPNIEYVITSCPCGNTDPGKYSPIGYRDWSEANGVPMVPVKMMCLACWHTVSFRIVNADPKIKKWNDLTEKEKDDAFQHHASTGGDTTFFTDGTREYT